MRNALTIVLIFAIQSLMFGQFPSLHNTEERICDYDLSASDVLTQFMDFDVFQTLDGTLDSPIDSSQCLEIELDGSIEFISLDKLDVTRPLYIRARIEDPQLYPLDMNELYHFSSHMPFDNHDLIDGNDCEIGDCTQLLMTVQLPNGLGGQSSKVYDYYYPECEGIESCFVTQNLEEQYLEEMLIKIIFDDDLGSTSIFKFPSLYLFNDWLPMNIENEISIEEGFRTSENSYEASFMNLFSYEAVLFQHDNGGFPSNSNIDFVEVVLEEKQSEQHTIDLISNEVMSVFFQDHVELRGELVEGSDSLRHNVNVTFDGTQLCVFSVELVSGGGVDLFFKNDAGIELNSKFSCVRIEDQSTMHVDQEVLQVGRHSIGMLALYDNSKVDVTSNSELIVGGNLLFHQREVKGQPSIHVRQGAKLAFSDNALVTRYNQDLQLLVYLYDDAQIDLTKLSVRDQSKIKVIHVSSNFANLEFNVYPNPASTHINMELVYEGQVGLTIVNELGREILNSELDLSLSDSAIPIDISELPQGIYFIMIQSKGELKTSKFIKL